MSIRKIVIPVAGYGTRFLPFTKSIPKEMLPIVDRPVIQYIVEEAVEAGIEQVILITGYSKRAIEDYFDYNLELEYLLEKSGKMEQRKTIRDISDMAKFVYIRQKEQLGNGHAILQAKEVIGDEPFAVVWGDEFFSGKVSRIQQLINTYKEYRSPVIFSLPMGSDEDYDRYGYMKVKQDMGDDVMRVDGVVEKPGKEKAPSKFISLGGYVFTPEIFPILESQTPGKGGEIWLVDAINTMAQKRPVFGKVGKNIEYYDCGNKLEYLKAVVKFGLARKDINGNFKDFLKGLNLS
jgi:UTP--glucose-1-phosphate uridylyltransferase